MRFRIRDMRHLIIEQSCVCVRRTIVKNSADGMSSGMFQIFERSTPQSAQHQSCFAHARMCVHQLHLCCRATFGMSAVAEQDPCRRAEHKRNFPKFAAPKLCGAFRNEVGTEVWNNFGTILCTKKKKDRMFYFWKCFRFQRQWMSCEIGRKVADRWCDKNCAFAVPCLLVLCADRLTLDVELSIVATEIVTELESFVANRTAIDSIG